MASRFSSSAAQSRNFYRSGAGGADLHAGEIVELAKALNGAVKAFAFGPVARTDDPASLQGRLPSFGAHVDYGRRTIEDITRDTLGQTKPIIGSASASC